jgi:hypothetical protein
MSVLTTSTKPEVCVKVGEEFWGLAQESFEFKIGQRVRTILGQNVKTPRVGFIVNRFRHDKEKTNIYQLLIDGRILNKRYLPEELESI